MRLCRTALTPHKSSGLVIPSLPRKESGARTDALPPSRVVRMNLRCNVISSAKTLPQRTIRLVASQGRPGSSQLNCTNGSPAARSARDRVKVSKSETAHIHDSSGWNPSGVGEPTRRCRLIFAGASRRIVEVTGGRAGFMPARWCHDRRLSSDPSNELYNFNLQLSSNMRCTKQYRRDSMM